VLLRSLPSAELPPRVLFLGSFPPRECGIATFTRDVVESFDREYGTQSDVVAVDEPGGESRAYGDRVVARLPQDERSAYPRLARAIDAHPSDVLDVQHEYGLFGGTEGAWFLDCIEAVRKPVVVSLHTVLPEPTPKHDEVVRRICERADAVVVLSRTGAGLLQNVYNVDPLKVHVIHHGVPDVPFASTAAAKARFGLSGRSVVSTFGLISRGKGLEVAIEAMRTIVARRPDTTYLILGQTHPGVRRHEGESYREELTAAIASNGLERNVALVDRYLDFDELIAYLGATDVYLTPYHNPVQIVSGTLAYAIGLGKAVVSTPYLYAMELLGGGHGSLVPFKNPPALAAAVLGLLEDDWARHSMERRAYRFGRQMTWPNVAREHAALFGMVASRRIFAAASLVRPA